MKQTFLDVRPDLQRYYKPELNGGKLMSDYKKGSALKVLLNCDVCHNSKKVEVRKLTNPMKSGNFLNFRCSYCNSLGVNFPEVAKEWHPVKNGQLTPYDVSKKTSRIKVWWKCEIGHEWQSYVVNRTNGLNRCPMCVHNTSKGEKIVSNWLLRNKIEHEIQHYVIINGANRFFDFYIPEQKIFVEIHGKQHFEDVNFYKKDRLETQQIVDRQKQEYAESNGYYVMVDYREHIPELALERFIDAMCELPI